MSQTMNSFPRAEVTNTYLSTLDFFSLVCKNEYYSEANQNSFGFYSICYFKSFLS